MNVSVRPPDFFRLFTEDAASSAGGSEYCPLVPPPLPPSGSSYTQFGGVYAEPPVFVPALASFGRQQLYDERCLSDPPADWVPVPGSGPWPTPKDELMRRVLCIANHCDNTVVPWHE